MKSNPVVSELQKTLPNVNPEEYDISFLRVPPDTVVAAISEIRRLGALLDTARSIAEEHYSLSVEAGWNCKPLPWKDEACGQTLTDPETGEEYEVSPGDFDA